MRLSTGRRRIAAIASIVVGTLPSATGCETDRFVQPRVEPMAMPQAILSGGVPINVKTGPYVEGQEPPIIGDTPIPPGAIAGVEVSGSAIFHAGQELQIWIPDASGRFVSTQKTYTVPTATRVVRFRIGRAQLFEGTPGQTASVPVLVVTEVEGELRGSAGVFTLSPAEPVAP